MVLVVFVPADQAAELPALLLAKPVLEFMPTSALDKIICLIFGLATNETTATRERTKNPIMETLNMSAFPRSKNPTDLGID